jgi:hypothetical protein
MKFLILVSAMFFCLASNITAECITINAIGELSMQPEKATFSAALKKSSAQKPLLISSKKEASEYFSEKDLKKLKDIDFSEQKVLVFAWRGSGKDKINYVVMESSPEQVRFSYKRGRTRDLRQHFKVFVLRKNVSYK